MSIFSNTMAAATGVVAFSAAAHATMIDFDAVEPSPGLVGVTASPHIEDGFILTSGGDKEFNVFGAGSFGYTGSASIFADEQNPTIGYTLRKADSTPFSLNSIDIDALFNDHSSIKVVPFTISFDAYTATGGTVSVTQNVDDIFGMQTAFFDPNDFGNVTEVRFDQGLIAETLWHMDNIDVGAPQTVIIPEPATMTLAAAGAYCVLGRRRRGGDMPPPAVRAPEAAL